MHKRMCLDLLNCKGVEDTLDERMGLQGFLAMFCVPCRWDGDELWSRYWVSS